MIVKSGWLEVREVAGKNSVEIRTCWCTLENGILWLYKKPGVQEGRDGVPLHDALVGECNPPAPFQLAVRCRRSGRVLALTATCKEDYTTWMRLLQASAREWSDKRRASMLNKQLMALALETSQVEGSIGSNCSYEDVKFAPRRKSEVPAIAKPVESFDDDVFIEVQNKRSTLKEIVDSSATEPASLRWAKLPEVIQSGLLGLLTEEQVALEELKFAALVEEFRYLVELKVLIQLATRAVSWDDPLVPPYHKRAIVNSLHKVKKSSEVVLRMAERHWSQKVTLQNAVFTLLGHEARVAAWQQTYTEFCSHLSELRSVFDRSIFDRPDMRTRAFSERYKLELALVPLQHLNSQRQLLQTIFELLPPGSPELHAARSTRDFLNEILDSCYQELTELDGSEYVAEMDNALNFDLSMITPVAPGPKLLNRQSSQKPANENDYDDTINGSDIDAHPAAQKMTKSKRPSLVDTFKSATAKVFRRNTLESKALMENRRATLPAFAFAPTNDNEFEEEEDEEFKKVEPEDVYEAGKVVPRFFIGEPLYQDYLMSIAEVSEDNDSLLDGDDCFDL